LLRIVPVTERRHLTDFIRVPWSVYRDDRHWIAPLTAERRLHLSKKNPYFAHAEAAFFVAYRGSEPVGRISAQINQLHLDEQRDDTGHFGFIEAIDDSEVFRSLFEEAESWLRQRGMKRILGPFNLSINDECGLLIEGFETPPMFLMGHGRPYYDARIKELGYEKAKDTFAYMLAASEPRPMVMEAALRRASERVHIRPVRLSNLKDELEVLKEIYNDAWKDNWSFIPFTTAEFEDMGKSLKYFVPPEFIQIVEVEGEPVAMIVAIPNLNDVIADLDGKLLPFGWMRLLWRQRYAKPTTGRVPLMGIRRKYQRSSLGMLLVFMLVNAVREAMIGYGIQHVELSWTLEDNHPMRRIMKRLGAREYKTYRFYERALVS
jgi:GNAT superfamily N-acetyltransferase